MVVAVVLVAKDERMETVLHHSTDLTGRRSAGSGRCGSGDRRCAGQNDPRRRQLE